MDQHGSSKGGPKKTLTVFALVMITTGIITSVHGAPSMAEYGFSLIFIYGMVAAGFSSPLRSDLRGTGDGLARGWWGLRLGEDRVR